MAKRKEKPLTPEEIKAKMIQQSSPQWAHSPPLLGLAGTPEGSAFIPLAPEAEKGTLLLFLLDWGDYLADGVLEILSGLLDEYAGLPWTPVIAYQPNTLYLKNTKFFDRYRNHPNFNTIPLFTDPTGDWFDLLRAEGGPVMAIVHQGIVVFKESMKSAPIQVILRAEQKLQEILRVEDPGLPLFGVRERTLKKRLGRGIISPDAFTLNGNWIRGAGSVMTEDSSATLSFQFEGEHLRLLAALHPMARDPCRFTVSLNDEHLVGVHYGPNTHQGDRGSAFVEIGRTQGIYEIIEAESALKGKITFKFLNAVENPVVLYSLHFA